VAGGGLPARDTRSRRLLALALYAAVALTGSWFLFRPTLRSGFALIQPDPGDSMLVTYLLEHERDVLLRPGYTAPLWSPPFFHPARNVLAYSENLLGVLPLYLLLRLLCDPPLSYQLLLILLCLLDFGAMLWVLRSLGTGPALAALGAFVFAFGNHQAGQIGHLQLFGVFYAPICVLLVQRLLAAPRRLTLALLALAVLLQLLSGIYLGWFLLLVLAIFVPLLLLADPAGRARLLAFIRRSPWFVAGAVALPAAAGYLLLRPYLAISRELGSRSWQDVLLFLPRLRSWVSLVPGSFYQRWWHAISQSGWTSSWEHALFPGLVPPALAVVALLYLLSPAGRCDRHRALLAACFGALAALVLLTLEVARPAIQDGHLVRAYPGISLWWLVFHLVPGAKAIRAVARVGIFVYLLGLIAACRGADAAIRRSRLRPAARGALLTVLLAAGIGEQALSSAPAFDKADFFAQVAALRQQISPSCHVLYASLRPGKSAVVSQNIAMWAGLESNLPVINGYSGNFPPRYPAALRSLTVEEASRWAGETPCMLIER
jgi:hypothetical protein